MISETTELVYCSWYSWGYNAYSEFKVLTEASIGANSNRN